MSRDLIEQIIQEIEGWTPGDKIKINYANDGDGYFDFMGLEVTNRGRDALWEIISGSGELDYKALLLAYIEQVFLDENGFDEDVHKRIKALSGAERAELNALKKKVKMEYSLEDPKETFDEAMEEFKKDETRYQEYLKGLPKD